MPERPEVLTPGARLKFVLNKQGEIEIIGNRKGLHALAEICEGLSRSSEDDHYHLDEEFWGTEPGSTSAIVYCQEKL